ncbi:Cytochrome p450 CYP199A2 [Mycolicibacterium vanbaalenii]|uniref:Cytochrome p450 CYP199A2 n=1 Tax=Mycolicibacterium vanbaalenii TaxID=110539 RepID=A0A5S9QXF9_MYCVN|nr:cytochrome P450 [Mycolicibacterium vanbaalenii]CAA0124845.1 Cytochrome p450 CYP199A2 [Mycolicibacterium vanbaalenii]
MTLTHAPHSDVDLFVDDILYDPYPTYRELRDAGSAVYLTQLDAWALPRYDDIRSALRDWKTFSSAGIALNDVVNEILTGTVIAADPPEHDTLRSVLSDRLAPRALRDLQNDIAARADTLVETVLRKESFDVVADLATAFPMAVVFDLIGLPEAARPNMLRWADATFDVCGPLNARAQSALSAIGEMFDWLGTLDAKDLKPDSMGRAIFDAADDGRIKRESCIPLLAAYTSAGMDTTINAIANAVHLFATHPDQWDLVCADPSILPAAFNEVLRYDAPVQVFGRRTTTDVTVGGLRLEPGTEVLILYGSGNRDDRHYAEPDCFDVTRRPTDHLTFGYATHACAGQALAKLEAHAVLGALAKRVRRFELGEPTRHLNNVTRGLSSLPVLGFEPRVR